MTNIKELNDKTSRGNKCKVQDKPTFFLNKEESLTPDNNDTFA